MGFKDALEKRDSTQGKGPGEYRYYGYDEREEKYWEWFEELETRFPQEIQCDMIEIAPESVKYGAKAYLKHDDNGAPKAQFVRISESTADRDDKYTKNVLLHEMVHLFFFQNGRRDVRDNSPLFRWVCGRVGCVMHGMMPWHDDYEEFAYWFLKEEEAPDPFMRGPRPEPDENF